MWTLQQPIFTHTKTHTLTAMVGANSTHTTVTDINEQLLPDYYHMVLPAFLCVCVYVRLQYSSRNISTQLNWLNNVEMWEMGIPLSAKAAFCVSKQLCYIVTDPDLISKSKLAYLNLLFNLSHKSEFTVKNCLVTKLDLKTHHSNY